MKKERILPATERPNPRSEHLDQMSSRQIVDLICSEDRLVPAAVGTQAEAIAAAIEMIANRLRRGGRLFYVGAGTSGRLGVLDASECPPTFGVRPSLVQGIVAGGRRALVRSAEGAEDHAADGAAALRAKNVGARDAVVGIAACGMTPFVRGALGEAQKRRAGTAFVTCAPEAVQTPPADIIINPVVGPEIITGSTRLKAGTATKLVLNALTTGTMIRLGKVYGNLMVDLRATNAKLRDRAVRIVMELTGLDRRRTLTLLRRANGDVKTAVVMHFRGASPAGARRILKAANQSLRRAIKEDE